MSNVMVLLSLSEFVNLMEGFFFLTNNLSVLAKTVVLQKSNNF